MSEQRKSCISCGVKVRDGIEHANDHDPDCRLVPEWNDADARIAEADRIVRELADMQADSFHDLAALIAAARAYVEAAK
jgi:hypothetical protein